MSSYFQVNNNASSMMNSIFSSLGNKQSGMSNMLGDYYAIQNGSYYKMAKKFYANKAVSNTSSSKTDSTSLSQKLEALESAQTIKNPYRKSTASKKSNTETMTATGDAIGTIGNLMSKKLYEPVNQLAEDGTFVSDYNRDTIKENLTSFIKNYNNVLDKVGDSNNRQTLEQGVRMINQTKVYERALGAVGIKIGEDNKLSLDSDTFAKADMSNVKALFDNGISFGKNIQNRMLELYSAESMSQTAVSGLYNAQAVSQLSVGSMFDSTF